MNALIPAVRAVMSRRVLVNFRVRPEVVAFVGISIYRLFFGKGASGGAGLKPEKISGASVFVLPNPSGLNANYRPAELVTLYAELRAAITSASR